MPFSRIISVFIAVALIYFAGSVSVPNYACAGGFGGGGASGGWGGVNGATSACDANYMQQLNQKAFLEAQREIELNGRYIWKPDSVLAMTCFQQAMNHASATLPEIFSEQLDSPRRQKAIDAGKAALGVPSSDQYPDHFADNMAKIIGPVLKKYIGANYSHPFSSLAEAPEGVSIMNTANRLKGFGVYYDGNSFEEGNVGYDFVWGREDPAKPPVLFQDFLRKDPQTPINNDCSWMRELWELSKCYSFDITDDFASVAFRDMKTGNNLFDKQDLRGKSCGENRPASAHGGKNLYNNAQRVLPAGAIISANVDLTTDLAFAETALKDPKFFDDVVSNFNTIIDEKSAGGCGAPIPTGVVVLSNIDPAFPESFCPNPGCHFNKTSCVPN